MGRTFHIRARAITAILTAAILYASLYPFHLHSGASLASDVVTLLSTYREGSSRSDLLANILLYLPFGFFAAHAFANRSGVPRILPAAAAGVLLSLAVELTQFYDLGRDSRLSDVYCNTAGALVGAIAARFIPLVPLRAGTITRGALVSGGLVACWLVSRLYPFVPAADIYKYWLAVKPLVRQPRLDLFDLYRHMATWMVLSLMFEDAVGRARARWAFLLFVPAVLGARIAIVENVLSPAEVGGAAIALAVWFAMGRRPIAAHWLAILFAGVIVVQGLAPFQFGPAHAFGWIPFLSFLAGSTAIGVRSLAEKTFLYGGLVWLMRKAGAGWPLAAAAGGALVFAVHYVQRWAPGRSAEITDTFIVLAAAGILKLLEEEPLSAWRSPR